MGRVTSFSVGRRWRCHRTNRISFDFVITGPGPTQSSKTCDIEPLPGQEAHFGKDRVDEFRQVGRVYSHKHLRKHAVLQPLGLDDIARASLG